ncbi:hypothetical protein CHLRE_11g482900v5 [Chlamydomonas reinhardtii]|uniref:Uncharacterized protein n=1 Tax=Chlamydomonas reinhardtii TaxID=3055 RepID=A8J7A7_CHLRE|nr:uncharacterized protein CHLRE_11g482900v5 [Chlamydomonas reinhardtii]PNW76964.1 hypothetical protein CHLRE_11g482900v5 [Chlamydomonas reinhardtii]|eukprot:XP_001697342.1 small rab-related GTPase [Chlamydomonas reinhardtii]
MVDTHDYTFKVLLVGDSGVGKSCILTRFTSGSFEENTTSTIGVDFKVKYLEAEGKRCKLTVWDTAGQERFRTLTSSYYRGAQGIIFVYDVTRRETFEALEGAWMREWDMYSTVEGAIQMVVANKTDLDSARQVATQEGHDFARRHGCLFVETSAKGNVAVGQAFEELLAKILDTPALLETTAVGGIKLGAAPAAAPGGACSC